MNNIELPALPRSQHSFQTSNDSDYGASYAPLYTQPQMQAYGRAILAMLTKAGTVVGVEEGHADIDLEDCVVIGEALYKL